MRTGIDLPEALHEHQQRSANKSKRVARILLNARDPARYRLPTVRRFSILPSRPSSTLRRTFQPFLIRGSFFLKGQPRVWGALSTDCPRVILRTFRHTRYTDPGRFSILLSSQPAFLSLLSFSLLRFSVSPHPAA